MSSHTNLPSPKLVPKPDHPLSTTSQTKKPPPSSSSSSSLIPQEQQQQTLKCPRCNSPNTKFCYYNNYSLSQPRHFCKSCRRYWTRGGALRNVPIGGGCRKTKKSIKPSSFPPLPPSSSSSQRFFSSIMEDSSTKFFTSSSPTTMDFQLAGLSLNKINDLQLLNSNQEVPGLRPVISSDQRPDVGSGLSLMGFGDYNNHSPVGYTTAGEASVPGGNLASSIETLSCLNQDLHWRLQQQRMAMLFGSKEDEEETVVVERPQPILYRNLEIVNSSSPTKRGENQTEWYFGNNSENEGVISNNGGNEQWNNNGNIQAWSDLNHYNALP